jgi:hypothetical protein
MMYSQPAWFSGVIWVKYLVPAGHSAWSLPLEEGGALLMGPREVRGEREGEREGER